MKTLAIFDLDGTLLNTITDLGNATNYALSKLGYPQHSIEAYKTKVGNGVTKLLERSLPDDARTPRTLDAMRMYFRTYYEEHMCCHSTPYPGIPELLDELHTRGVALAVASNKYQAAVDQLVHHFFGHLPWVAVHGHREGVPVKPDPSIVFAILNEHPTPKANVLYIGDSGVDMETARRACVDSCGVTWGFRTRRELTDAYATHLADTPADILRFL